LFDPDRVENRGSPWASSSAIRAYIDAGKAPVVNQVRRGVQETGQLMPCSAAYDAARSWRRSRCDAAESSGRVGRTIDDGQAQEEGNAIAKV